MPKTIAIVGLGYVGLPLAVAFGSKRPVLGFDIDAQRIAELQAGHDRTLEVDGAELGRAEHLRFSADRADLAGCSIFIITVPTPIDAFKRPDLHPLLSASRSVGECLKPGDLVIYESTVYPGATEEDCVPVLERHSGLAFNTDFFVGYSPERINPGDKRHRLPDIMKVTSGSTPAAADEVDALYREIIAAGTYRAPSIKVAEAAKVIENTQRDLNIALVNELALIFDKMGIDTLSVLEAAGTKWNFLPFKPGLVGGHCISVDPYYLTHKAQHVGYHPEVILAGRRINDQMGEWIAQRVIRALALQGRPVRGSDVLILGLTFKENCPDLRNTRVVDIVAHLQSVGINVHVHDPLASSEEARHEHGISLSTIGERTYSACIVAVAHDQYKDMGADAVRNLVRDGGTVFDLKGVFPQTAGFARV